MAGRPACFVDGNDLARNEIPDTATTVLLGECTHGTEEFYELRAECLALPFMFIKYSCLYYS